MSGSPAPMKHAFAVRLLSAFALSMAGLAIAIVALDWYAGTVDGRRVRLLGVDIGDRSVVVSMNAQLAFGGLGVSVKRGYVTVHNGLPLLVHEVLHDGHWVGNGIQSHWSRTTASPPPMTSESWGVAVKVWLLGTVLWSAASLPLLVRSVRETLACWARGVGSWLVRPFPARRRRRGFEVVSQQS